MPIARAAHCRDTTPLQLTAQRLVLTTMLPVIHGSAS